jgi:hypothetical protein
MERVRAGHVMVRNPRNAKQVLRVSLLPDDVAAVVYWSRDYGRLLPLLPELDDRGLAPCFHLTLNDYGPPLERRAPSFERVVEQLAALADRYGPDRVIWRYDPIVIGSRHDTAFHAEHFDRLASATAPHARRCVVSFLDRYPSTRRELASVSRATGETFDPPSASTRRAVAERLAALARDHGLSLTACCEVDVADLIPPARCIDPDLLTHFMRGNPDILRASPTRKGCGCVFARDVGAYHMCGHGCAYCYANESPEAGLRNAQSAEPSANHLGRGGDIEPSKPAPRHPLQLTLGNNIDVRAYDDEESR